MSSQRDANITSYFRSKERATPKPKPEPKTGNSNPLDVQTETPKKDNGKRPISSPTPPPPEKRQDTKNTAFTHRNYMASDDLPSNWLTSNAPISDGQKTLQLTYHKGDIFGAAPENCLLVHACNTQGHWGAGIAKAFKDRYPAVFKVHHNFCAKLHSKTNPVPTGTAQLLAPVDGGPQHWIGCVFTSAKYGKAKDKPNAIVKNTVSSIQMLLELVKLADEQNGVSAIRMCKINSGKFGVPWEKTEEALQGIVLQEGWRTTIEVWEP